MKLDTNSDAMKQRKPLRAKLKEYVDQHAVMRHKDET